MIEIRETVSYVELEAARVLMRASRALPNLAECAVGFAEEIATLPGRYAPPTGALLVAWDGGAAVGCVGLRGIGDRAAEMKRLFVTPAACGAGAGRALAEALIVRARELGYTTLRLDTLPWMERAIALYRALAFSEVERYYNAAPATALFFELAL
jgi:ribosomal protein S18 acetylase RimI-like enzyme